MYKFKQWLYRFMQGRYGVDELYKFTFVLFIVVVVLSAVFSGTAVGAILSVLETVLLVVSVFRVFSRNIAARSAENAKYLKLREPVIKTARRNINRVRDIKTKRYRKCPNCKTWVKLPVKKGTHGVNCPTCKQRFEVRIRF